MTLFTAIGRSQAKSWAFNMSVSPSRSAAFDILLRVEREDSYASELLHAPVYAQLSTPDHSLATELVMGVLRWRSLLDEKIADASSQPLSKLDVEILIALRLALYQFQWLDRVPRRAALHESVELVKRARKRSAAPFVNAVLHKLSTASPNHDTLADNAATAATLARAFAHPQWMVERWTKQFGFSAAQHICKHNQLIPTTAIRLRIPSAEAELRPAGITFVPGSLLASARRIHTGDVTKTRVFHEGEIVIQDEASQLVGALVGCEVGNELQILDCCAAPGGKMLAIADQNPGASIAAIELHFHRARLLQRRIRVAHAAARIHVIAADARHLPFSHAFDLVLADVPCSGTGTLSRNPEIKWRIKPDDLRDLQARQSAILRSALAVAAPGGRLIYSTCSLEREENEDVVEAVLAESKSFRLLDCNIELERLKTIGELTWPDVASLIHGPYLRTMPGVHPCDGFFAAILEKIK
jgi:16S rRNA (cytosine967-C5)-methyltransferase